MKLPVNISGYTIARDCYHRGMLTITSRECLGSIDADKLLDDLPRVIGRSLSFDEQVSLRAAVPKCAA